VCAAPVATGGWTKEKYGYQGTKVSGKTTSRAPLSAASASAARTLDTVPPGVSRSRAICTAATRTSGFAVMPPSSVLLPASDVTKSRPHTVQISYRPSMDHEGVVATVQQDEIEHVERVD